MCALDGSGRLAMPSLLDVKSRKIVLEGAQCAHRWSSTKPWCFYCQSKSYMWIRYEVLLQDREHDSISSRFLLRLSL